MYPNNDIGLISHQHDRTLAMSTPHPHAVLFARGTLARLALWPTLCLAVHASWGGPASPEKQRWLAGVLVDQFEPCLVPPVAVSSSASSAPTATSTPTTSTPTPPDATYIEDLLLQIMSDEFDVDLEDDSAAAVARDLVRLFERVQAGDEAFVRELEAQADRVKGTMPKYEIGAGSESESGSGSEGEWEDEDEDEDECEGESVPHLLNHSESRTREEPQVDEDGFTVVKKKGRR